jgi:transposase-like protein
MSRGYRNKTKRSRRKYAAEASTKVVSVEVRTSDQGAKALQFCLPIPELVADLGAAMEDLARRAGVLMMCALIEDEVEDLAGVRYRHDPDREATRWGTEEGHVVLGGRKIPIRRPRVRGVDGRERELERYRLFQADGRLQQAVGRHILAGVSTRDYERTLDDFCEGYGIQKSSVSRQWKAISAQKLEEFLQRPLDGLNLAAILVDGCEFQGILLVVALGIDADGRKHVLGFVEGATENTAVCDTLLDQLIERGLQEKRPYLFVLDGSKALKKSVVKRFGKDVAIQRCIEHKKRNVCDHLPKRHQAVVRMKLRAAWNMTSYTEARAALQALIRYLADLNPSAARSLEEGLEETLTLHRLGVSDLLRKTLRTTNLIESAFSTTRHFCANVKRWRDGRMVQRWAGTMLLEVERRIKRVKGHRDLPTLLPAIARLIDQNRAAA